MNTITQAIKIEMARQGLTPWQIEKATGVNHSAIQRMIDGTDLRCDTADKLMKHLNLAVAEREGGLMK